MPNPSSIWKRVLSVAHRSGFTQNEAGVIVFLAVAMLTGGTIEAFRDDGAQAQRLPGGQDVRKVLAAQDSVFAARSSQTGSTSSTTEGAGAEAPIHEVVTGQSQNAPAASININRASEGDLLELPGIGPATAKKIVAHRKEQGPFERIEDIMLVKSIGPKKFEKLRQFIRVE
ncbi:MAG: helix-hairpin-helix domain-containing protein [Bacteroidetes bacterium]|nr:helix-hairpin-helix domain-containing protein [Bacteroidota bacterium]